MYVIDEIIKEKLILQSVFNVKLATENSNRLKLKLIKRRRKKLNKMGKQIMLMAVDGNINAEVL